MSDLALQTAGVLAMAVAVIHGVLGETAVFARATIEPPRLRLLIRLVWQCGALAWFAGGVLLLVAAALPAGSATRVWIVTVLVVVYAAAAAGNAWATRGRHIGWVAMTAVVALSVTGI